MHLSLANVEKTISAHSYYSVLPLDKRVEYRQMVWNALNSVNPDLGYWMSEYYILYTNNEIGGGGRRNLTMKRPCMWLGSSTMVSPLCHKS